MRVFLTGATGFIGSYLVPELVKAGHRVVGLSRSDAGAEALIRDGAEVVRGDVNDLDCMRTATTPSARKVLPCATSPRRSVPG